MGLSENIKQYAYRMGFDIVSISSAVPDEKAGKRYQKWRSEGFAGEMAYMVRENPRRWVPQDLLPEAKSIITFGVNFFSEAPRAMPKKGYGRVARYAWGKDYHHIVKKRLEEWTYSLKELAGREVKSKIMVDSGPLLERSYAERSGTGFVGKNTLIINRKLGSYIFLSEILTDLDLEPDAEASMDEKDKDACGSCRLCISDCPTGALVAPRQLDARKCISYWTIENRGEIPHEMRAGIGDWIFGCDICQEVCPYNGLPRQTQWREFLPGEGAGPYLSLLDVLSISKDEDFRKRFAGTPILRSKRAGLVRNGCVVAANQNFEEALPLLEELSSKDTDAMIRSHAAWSIVQLRSGRSLDPAQKIS